MSEPTHNPAPVDLPDIDLTAPVMCEHIGGCGRKAEWECRPSCPEPHRWFHYCTKHAEEVRDWARAYAPLTCRHHGVPFEPDPLEWRPL
ncbi:MAG: hypothetical protein M0Z51_14750 [Propionibacterium sp.]|nr:hypothetical protein [Propionibacterium sp.]